MYEFFEPPPAEPAEKTLYQLSMYTKGGKTDLQHEHAEKQGLIFYAHSI